MAAPAGTGAPIVIWVATKELVVIVLACMLLIVALSMITLEARNRKVPAGVEKTPVRFVIEEVTRRSRTDTFPVMKEPPAFCMMALEAEKEVRELPMKLLVTVRFARARLVVAKLVAWTVSAARMPVLKVLVATV